jgi:hypothetical protein
VESARRASKLAEQRLNFVACAPRWPTCDCGMRNSKAVILELRIMTWTRTVGFVQSVSENMALHSLVLPGRNNGVGNETYANLHYIT